MEEPIKFIPEDIDYPWKEEFSAICGHCNCSSWFKLVHIIAWIKINVGDVWFPWARMKPPDEKEWEARFDYDEDEEIDEKQNQVAYSIYQCMNCMDLTFVKWTRLERETSIIAEKIYPTRDHLEFELYPGGGSIMLPEIVRSTYLQAKAIEKESPTAFVLLIRRALEAICRDRGAKKGTLANKINTLIEAGELPQKFSDFSEIIRLVGNISAHDTDIEIPETMATAIDSLFRAVVEYIYIAPAKVKIIKRQLERIKTKPKPNI